MSRLPHGGGSAVLGHTADPLANSPTSGFLPHSWESRSLEMPVQAPLTLPETSSLPFQPALWRLDPGFQKRREQEEREHEHLL